MHSVHGIMQKVFDYLLHVFLNTRDNLGIDSSLLSTGLVTPQFGNLVQLYGIHTAAKIKNYPSAGEVTNRFSKEISSPGKTGQKF